MVINNKANNKIKISIIQKIAAILVIVIPFGLAIPREVRQEINPSLESIERGDARISNNTFRDYFGTEKTASETKELLSNIRTNNLTAMRSEEQRIIGVCLIADSIETEAEKGIYNKSEVTIDLSNLKKDDFDDMFFTSNLVDITNKLQSVTTYTIGSPNEKIWNNREKTGFEIDENKLGENETEQRRFEGNIQKGETGGYYITGYMRLIYIIQNY